MINIRWKKNNKNKYDIKTTLSEKLDEKDKNLKKKINYDTSFGKIDIGYDKREMTVKADGKEIMVCKYLNIGIYNKDNKVWYWAWNTQFIDKELNIKTKIEQFRKMIEDKYSNFTPHEADEYYFYTNNCNFFIEKKYIDRLLGIVVSVIDCEGYFVIEKDTTIEYVLITELIKVK